MKYCPFYVEQQSMNDKTSIVIFFRFSEVILANLLSVKPALCCKTFDMTVDDLRFVGFPMLLEQSTKPSSTGKISHQIGSFNIAFVLKVN